MSKDEIRVKLRKLFSLGYDIGRTELEAERLRTEYLRVSQELEDAIAAPSSPDTTGERK